MKSITSAVDCPECQKCNSYKTIYGQTSMKLGLLNVGNSINDFFRNQFQFSWSKV